MAYPGVIFAAGLGFGIAAIIYYLLAYGETENCYQYEQSNQRQRRQNRQQRQQEQKRQQEQQRQKEQHPSNGLDEVSNKSSSSHPENLMHKRLQNCPCIRCSSNGNNLECQNPSNCSICQYPIIPFETMQLPCGHVFHLECVHKLRTYYPSSGCPNCRKPFDYHIS